MAELTEPIAAPSELPVLTGPEREQVTRGWNRTARDYPHDTVHHLFALRAEAAPGSLALVQGSRRLTYQELHARSNQLARHMQNQGVGAETLVGLCLDRSPDLVVAILAILKAGGAYVPFEPALPAQRVQHILADTKMGLVVTREKFAGLFRGSGARPLCIDSAAGEISREGAEGLAESVSPDNLAYAIYTSGSTGVPKAALITHRSVVNHAHALIAAYDVSAADRRLQFGSINSDVLTAELFPYLLSGATVVFQREPGPVALGEFLHFLNEEKITIVGLPSAYWHEWAASTAEGDEFLPPSLRMVISAMDRASPELLKVWKEKVRGRVRWCNGYGPTETTVTATLYETGPDDDRLPSVPIGRPIANVRTYVLDEHQNPVPVGVPGELCIGGHGVARGYLNRPELTAQRFLPDPFSDEAGARFYRTGDLCRYLPDGNLEFLGRLDHQVKIRGFRVELGEVEAALRRHPGVRETVVLAREDDRGDKQLVAYVVPREGAAPPAGELRRHLQQQLPEHFVPAAFVPLDRLPLTSSGKVDRQALPAPVPSPEPGPAPVLPRTPMEETLAAMWGSLLGVSCVGVHDNFFHLGGHSLRATRLAAMVRAQLHLEISLRDVFECPTVETLALRLLEQQARGLDPRELEELLAELGSLPEEDALEKLRRP